MSLMRGLIKRGLSVRMIGEPIKRASLLIDKDSLLVNETALVKSTVPSKLYQQSKASYPRLSGHPLLVNLWVGLPYILMTLSQESEVETMTKVKALILSILCAALAVSFVSEQQITLMWAFAGLSILFLSVWLYKYQRDRAIVTHARLEHA